MHTDKYAAESYPITTVQMIASMLTLVNIRCERIFNRIYPTTTYIVKYSWKKQKFFIYQKDFSVNMKITFLMSLKLQFC